jgi:hypothetical protein
MTTVLSGLKTNRCHLTVLLCTAQNMLLTKTQKKSTQSVLPMLGHQQRQPPSAKLPPLAVYQPAPLTSLRCRRVTSTTTVASSASLTADLLRFRPARSFSDLLPRVDRGRASCSAWSRDGSRIF